AERAAGIAAAAALLGALGALLFDQRHGAVEPDGEHVVTRREIGVGLAVLHVGPEAADAGDDRLAVVGMLADLAREGKQPQRAVELVAVGGGPLRQAGALGLPAPAPLAERDVGPEAPRAQRHFEAARGVLPELLHAAVGPAVGAVAGRELARIAAFRIIRAADETAELAELE